MAQEDCHLCFEWNERVYKVASTLQCSWVLRCSSARLHILLSMVNICVLWQRRQQPPLHCSLVFMHIKFSNVAHEVPYGEYLCGVAEIAAATTGVYVDTVQQSCVQSWIWWIFMWCCRDHGGQHVRCVHFRHRWPCGNWSAGEFQSVNTQDPVRSTPQNTSSVNLSTAELGSVIALFIFSRTCDSRTLLWITPPPPIPTPTPL